jgi:hypothetical protein
MSEKCAECKIHGVCDRCMLGIVEEAEAKAGTPYDPKEDDEFLAMMKAKGKVLGDEKRTVRVMVGVDCRRPGDNWSCTCELMETGTCDYCIEKVEDDKELEIEMAQYRAAKEEREIDRLVHVARESRSMDPQPYVEAAQVFTPIEEKRLYLNLDRWAHEDMLIAKSSVM